MSLEWSKEKTEALVSLYHQHQCLYDPTHYLYRDRNERKKTISYIATVLQTSENSITSKIKNIRSQLWREKWKDQHRELNGIEDYRGKWWLKDSLQFLNPFLVLKPSSCCLQLDDGQPLQQVELTPESEEGRKFVPTANMHIDYQHPINGDHRATVHEPPCSNDADHVDNSGQLDEKSYMDDLHEDNEEAQLRSDQISAGCGPEADGRYSHQIPENHSVQEINQMQKDHVDGIPDDQSVGTINISSRFISNYPTGIFKNDCLLDAKNRRLNNRNYQHGNVPKNASSNFLVDTVDCVTGDEEVNMTGGAEANVAANYCANSNRYERTDGMQTTPPSNNMASLLKRLRKSPSISNTPVIERLLSGQNVSLLKKIDPPSLNSVHSEGIEHPIVQNEKSNIRSNRSAVNQTKSHAAPLHTISGQYAGGVGSQRIDRSKVWEKPSGFVCKRTKNNLKSKFESAFDGGHLMVQAVSCLERVSNRLANEDEYSVFGKHVANELRSVTSIEAQRWARMKIQNILYEAQTFANPNQSTTRSLANEGSPENKNSLTNNVTVQSTSTD